VFNDRELILQLQRGSLQALGDLYDRHQRMVYRTALGITGDDEAAADLLQEVFLRMHRFAARIDPERPLEPWLYRATANLAYTWVKRHNRWFRPLEDFAEWLAGEKHSSPLHVTELEEDWQSIREAVAALPVSHRVVVVLYYVNDLSLQEISEILEVPIGTVKSRLYYGRQTLKKQLDTGDAVFGEVHYEFT
jgi:RNA polymerase sigma-70 factor (ECF subfamily)